MGENQKTRLLTAAITALAGLIPLTLGIGGIRLYCKGKAAVTAGTATAIFSRESAAAFLKELIIPVCLLILLLAAAALRKGRGKESRPYLPKVTERDRSPGQTVGAWRGMDRIRYTMGFLLAGALLVAGMINGGMRDVLIKAINICTECIGLG